MSVNVDERLEAALGDLSAALNATGAAWMIIGGIAVIARGVRRFTGDIDAAIRGDEIEIPGLISALAKHRIVPRIAGAERFARESMVLLLRHELSGVDFDVSFAWTSFEHEAIAAATLTAFGAVQAPMARPEDLIVFKAIAGRGRDMDDVTALLTLYPKVDIVRIRARVQELSALADAPSMPAGLETAIAASKKVRLVRDVWAPAARPARSGLAKPRKTSRPTAKKAPRSRLTKKKTSPRG